MTNIARLILGAEIRGVQNSVLGFDLFEHRDRIHGLQIHDARTSGCNNAKASHGASFWRSSVSDGPRCVRLKNACKVHPGALPARIFVGGTTELHRSGPAGVHQGVAKGML